MLKLITGTPGSGKTLNTIKMVRKETAIQQGKVFALFGATKSQPVEARAVYYHGIKDINPDFGWHELTDEQALKWFDLPSGSILIFDEAYNLFPTSAGKNPPEHVKRLAVHRHQGFDIYMICQKVTGQIDPFVKGLINEHHHFERLFGSTMVNHFVWGRCESDINSRSARSDSDHRIIPLDKSLFGTYKSADVHTHKPRLPVNIIVVLVIALAVVVYAFRNGTSVAPVSHVPVAVPQVSQAKSQNPVSLDKSESPLDPLNYLPRVEGLPWTAPVYDSLRQPRSFPRLSGCMLNLKTNTCTCYTQQATKLNVPESYCLSYIQNGAFDDSRPDPDIQPSFQMPTIKPLH
jgi:zona occludens toxin